MASIHRTGETPKEKLHKYPGVMAGRAMKKVMYYRPRRRKRKFVACLLSAVFPGLGHLYLRMFLRGMAIIYLLILDASALIYFSSVRMTINIPLLFILAFLIPIMYFFSIYDVLQSTDQVNAVVNAKGGEISASVEGDSPLQRGRAKESIWRGIGAGVLLMVGGVVVFLFSEKPPWLEKLIYAGAGYAVGVMLIGAGLLFVVRECKRRLLRLGRLTASFLLGAVGAFLLVDTVTGSHYVFQLQTWWPALLIIAGLELIFVFLVNRTRTSRPMRMIRVDLRGLLLAICMAFSVFIVTQQDHYMHLWNKVSLDLTTAAAEFSLEEGYHSVKETLEIPIDLITEQITINALNGDIDVRKAQIEGVRIETVVWVDQLPKEEAVLIAEETYVSVTEGRTLNLSVKDRTYGSSGKRHPRMNMVVYVPENRFLDLDVSTLNGRIRVSGARALKEISLQTGNGNLKLWDVVGNVTAKTLNGDTELYRIYGDIHAETQGGNMIGNMITGKTIMSTLVGNIALFNSGDDIELATKNGNITVKEVHGNLKAESLNGKLEIVSPIVNGDWNIYSGVGDITIVIPEEGNYRIEGSSGYGMIESDFSFTVENKMLSGVVGLGDYLIKIEGNSNLFVNKYRTTTDVDGEGDSLNIRALTKELF